MNATKHHKIHSWTGWGVIFGLPFAVFSVFYAMRGGPAGITDWVSAPLTAVGLGGFLTAAIWYAKLEMDEVILDYASGGMRQFGLLANRLVALLIWGASIAGLVLAAFV